MIASTKKALVFITLLSINYLCLAQNNKVSIHLNTKHQVGEIDSFDRKKFINIHAISTGHDWKDQEEELDYLINDLDVYFGRDNGGTGWYMNQTKEDEENPGYASPKDVENQGKNTRQKIYGIRMKHRHKYDNKLDIVVGSLEHPFWPGDTTKPYTKKGGWKIGGAKASGDFLGRYLKEFYRNKGEGVTEGAPRPKWFEVINEPLYELVTTGDHEPAEVFEYHNIVAQEVRKHVPDIKIGGYTTAFPIFERNNFARWEERMKLFYDMSAENMDFISVHLYDFNKHHFNNGKIFKGPVNHKGSRVEATLDMMEHYSQLKFNTVKPFMISEFGGRDHSLEWKKWTPGRDWLFMKSFSPLLLSFMERPNLILKTIPFIVPKAEWGNNKGIPYPWRLFRKVEEGGGEEENNSNQWVLTEMIKFFELWSDVKGTRIDTKSSNPNILVDSYTDKKKTYIILSNLDMKDLVVDLDLLGNNGNKIKCIKSKHLYGNENGAILEKSTFKTRKDLSFNLGAEATAIIEYTFKNELNIENTMLEKKYYATTYLKEIKANTPIEFDFDNIDLGLVKDGMLRIGIGRDHGKSLQPQVKINGKQVMVHKKNYRGDDQNVREQFFGLLEVHIPKENLKENNNKVSLTFKDDGGHISSMSMQVFNYER